MLSLAAQIRQRINTMPPPRPGWCVACKLSLIAGGASATSQTARRLGLCGRCYNDTNTRRRHAQRVMQDRYAERRIAEVGVFAAAHAALETCELRAECESIDGGEIHCPLGGICEAVRRLDLVLESQR